MADNLLFSEEGFKLPSLCRYYKKKPEQMTREEKEEDRDLTDGELMERDLVKVKKSYIISYFLYLILCKCYTPSG